MHRVRVEDSRAGHPLPLEQRRPPNHSGPRHQTLGRFFDVVVIVVDVVAAVFVVVAVAVFV